MILKMNDKFEIRNTEEIGRNIITMRERESSGVELSKEKVRIYGKRKRKERNEERHGSGIKKKMETKWLNDISWNSKFTGIRY